MSLVISVTFTAHTTARASDLEQMKSDIQTWANSLGVAGDPTSFTSSWDGDGSAVAMGNGSLAASYIAVGKIRIDTIILSLGSTSSTGNGSWYFGLSTAAANGAPMGGTCTFHKASGSRDFPGTLIIKDTTHIYCVMTGGTDATTGHAGNGVPVAAFTPAGDVMYIQAIYQIP